MYPPVSFCSLYVCESCSTIFPDVEMRRVQDKWICEYCWRKGRGGERVPVIDLSGDPSDQEKR